MNQLEPKKGTKVKMIVEGIFQGEADMTKPLKWFTNWSENFENRINKKFAK